MKKIIYNYDKLKERDITRNVQRAKAIIINSKDELLFGYGNNNYQLIGGHVEEFETSIQALVREIFEETGIQLQLDKIKPFIKIIYYSKDYPNIGVNSKYVANYYIIKTNKTPDYSKINLTENEKEGMFTLKYIKKEKVLDELKESLNNCTKQNVVKDTIKVVEEFLCK